MQKFEQGPGDSVLLTGFNTLMGDILARVLSFRGFAVSVATTPKVSPSASAVVAEVEPNTLARLNAIAEAWPGVPVVVVTSSPTAALHHSARRNGVAAVIHRAAGIEDLVRAISMAQAGERLELHEIRAADSLADLTERETAVLRLVADGSSNAEIGEALHVSPHTARTHVQNVMTKLGVRNRLAAAAIAREAGLTARHGS